MRTISLPNCKNLFRQASGYIKTRFFETGFFGKGFHGQLPWRKTAVFVQVPGQVGVLAGQEELGGPQDGDAVGGEREPVDAAALCGMAGRHEARDGELSPGQTQSGGLHPSSVMRFDNQNIP